MKKFLKLAGGILVVIIIALGAFVIYFNSTYPDVDPPMDVTIEITPERIERGAYLANHVAVCMDCHSTRDWTRFSGPPLNGTLGKGGEVFNEDMGLPGTIYSKNITPAALNSWTDGEIIRAIVQGVSKTNSAYFPIMPYTNYNKLTEEDLYSIVAYLRSLSPIENEVPESELNFPLNMIVKTMPVKTYTPASEPDKNNSIEYGKYLATLGGCTDCHTQAVNGEFVEGMSNAGGQIFNMPGGVLQSSNITPDKSTGIGSWSKEDFIGRFRVFDPDSTQLASVKITDYNTVMPWSMYAQMTDDDLSAIYDYLTSQKPVNNSTTRWKPRH